jgi:phage gp29-like protein
VHDGLREDIEVSDARQLSATVNRDLVRPLIDLNRGRRKKYPKVIIGRPDEEDVATLVDNVVKLVPLGLQVGMATMQKKIGLPAPAADDELLSPRRSDTPAPAPERDRDEKHPARSAAPHQITLNSTRLAGQADAIDEAVGEIMADGGWRPLIEPVVEGLADELAGAQSPDEARAILRRRAETMGVAAFTTMLANAAFGARLAGEADEELTDGN